MGKAPLVQPYWVLIRSRLDNDYGAGKSKVKG